VATDAAAADDDDAFDHRRRRLRVAFASERLDTSGPSVRGRDLTGGIDMTVV
jgi:hypothetical protein